jgi:hypothetical protein
MDYFVFMLVGLACGGLSVFVALDRKRRQMAKVRGELEELASQVVTEREEICTREQALNEETSRRKQAFEEEMQRQEEEHLRRIDAQLETICAREQQVNEQASILSASSQEFEQRVISFTEVQGENGILKRDLRNLAVSLRKLELDHRLQQESQETLDQKVQELGDRYLKENVKWIGKSLNANNFVACKQRLQEVIERCRGIGFPIAEEQEATYLADLRAEYEKMVRAAFEREEQARIKAQIREEQKREREIQRELQRIDRDRSVLQAALERALAEAQDQYSAEVEDLKTRLAEAEAARERTISQAQLTKAGHIYVISNIGSFGEGVFKIGMTRRLEPLERVKELGDASVPYPFDVHMMISCDDAPALENALHRQLLKQQLNKMNPRKEFFKADLEVIAAVVREHHGEVEYVADPEALEYRQSLTMSDEDQEFIEHVFDELEEDDASLADGASVDASASE